jgi:hypothetical protein
LLGEGSPHSILWHLGFSKCVRAAYNIAASFIRRIKWRER